MFVCSERQLKKKASVLFGIRFDDKKYSELKAHLDTIDENRDLVCVSKPEKKTKLKQSSLIYRRNTNNKDYLSVQ